MFFKLTIAVAKQRIYPYDKNLIKVSSNNATKGLSIQHGRIFLIANIFYPPDTLTCAYQEVKKFSFLENSAFVLNELSLQ